MANVPISCATCGWRLGRGSPGALVPCVHCGCWVTAKAMRGDFDGAVAGLAVVAIFALLAILIALILAVLLGRRSR